ncbi:transporter substrate-binding domain-containing protein [Pseudomonas sp. NPDC078700]|uniref:transporter substrate-binding domain-containing protein n=1 Tax=Pseudomonas sp. NPDC078700 TaxID=3364424 RepID=UPI0037C61913
MANYLRGICLLFLCLSSCTAAYADQPFTRLKLLGQSQWVLHGTQLSDDNWQWLRKKETLILGTFGTDYPPFRLGADSNEFSGVTADIVSLISRELGVKVVAHLYQDRPAAVAALNRGEVDMLTSLGPIEEAPDLLKTEPYIRSVPVLVQHTGDGWAALDEGLSGRRVAYNFLDMSRSQAETLAPGATLTSFSNDLDAFSSVAFGTQDVVLSDAISANYLVNTYYANELKVTNLFRGAAPNGSRFILRNDNERLLNILNHVIQQGISPEQRQDILKHWSGGGLSSIDIPTLPSSLLGWIQAHPVLRVGVYENFPPYSYFGNDDRFYGITADLLARIQRQTNLEVVVTRFANIDGMLEGLLEGKVDLVADISPTDQRREQMEFSRAYISAPYALVTEVDHKSAVSLEQMSNKRIAIAKGHALVPYLQKNYPDIKLVEALDSPDALALVAAGEADATIQPLLVARYYISRLFHEKLRISTTLSQPLAASSFAMRRESRRLQTIINSVLVDISPDEYSTLINRWRTRVALSPPSWRSYKPLIYQAITVAFIVLMIFLGWNFYLRNQIRQRRVAERELSEQMKFMELLINGTPHPIYVRDIDMSVRLCNDSYLEALGATREDVIGQSDLRHFSEEDAQDITRDHHRVIVGREPIIIDRMVTLNGQSRVIYHWKLPYVDRNEVVRGIIGGWIDISDRRALIEQLRAAKDQADAANRTKTTFLATMSHEIRTPLNAIIGMLELALKRDANAPPDHASLEVAYNSARGLLELIGDILDVAQIESGHLNIHPERAELRQIAAGVVRVFEGLAKQKSLRLRLELEGALEEHVLLDPLRFRQVLSNLVSNAIKFTAQGSVCLKLVGTPLTDNYIALRVEVSDTGIGIPEKYQASLFQPFVQVNETSGGSGLGLMICSNLVEMMGGSLDLESQEGVGTRVSLELKLLCLETDKKIPEASTTVQEIEQSLPQFTILVVDDHPANRMLLAQQLAYLGQRVECAVDGESAFTLWQSQHFDLVITDCNMPGMDGYTLSRAIRSTEQTQGANACTILGFTANAQAEMLRYCVDAGMNGCLFKPVELADLTRALTALKPPKKPPNARPEIFDHASLEQITGGNKAIYLHLLEQVQISIADDLASLEPIIMSGDLTAFADLAHRCKGAAKIIKATQLVSCCEALEQACEAQDVQLALEKAQEMKGALQTLANAIEHITHNH